MAANKLKPARILIGLVIIGVVVAGIVWVTAKPAKAGWFDDNWSYRQKITIGNSGAADADKKVKFDIDTATLVTAGKMQSDCDDTRFTDANGKLLKYFLDTAGGACNGASTDYYVLYNTINAGNTDIYMYYGNPSASIGSEAAQFSQATFSPTSGPTLAAEEKGTGPIAYWKFDEGVNNTCSGGTNDTCNSPSNTANDGAITNGTAWQTEDMCVSGKCLKFDGSDDVVTITNNNSIDFDTGLIAAVTFEAWFKANSDGEGDTGQIFQKGTTTFCRVDTEASGSVDVQCSLDLATSDATLNISAPVTTNSWNHLAMAYTDDGDDEITIYINGIARGSSGDGSGAPASSDANNLLWGGTTTANFHGFLDEAKVYNYERTAAQIKTDYVSRGALEGAGTGLGADNDNSAALASGLLGYWKQDEASGNLTDSSGNGATATVTGTTVVQGKFGNARNYDGSSDKAEVADNDRYSINTTNKFTVVGWFYPTALSGSQDPIAKASNPFEWALRFNGTTPEAHVFNSTGTDILTATSSVAVANNQWVHVAMTIDLNEPRTTIYINGIQTGSSGTLSGTYSNTAATLNFGNRGDELAKYIGRIDDARIYNRALMGGEISALYEWAPDPVAYYNFDENTGASAVYDRSGNSNDGTMNGSMTQANWVPGRYGSALDFDGTDDYISVLAAGNQQITGDVSFGAWFRADTITDGDVILYLGGGAGETEADNELYLLRWNTAGGNDLEHKHENGAGVNNTSTFNTNLSLGTWYHAMVVRDVTANTNIVYVNGTLLDTAKVYTNDPTGGTSSTFKIGGDTTDFFDGIIDEVKVYNYMRTGTQVVEDMNAGHPAGGSPIGSQTIYYKFDEQQGATVNNTIVTNVYTETVAGGASWIAAGSSTCKINGCLDFDGSNDEINVTNVPSIDLNIGLINGFTVSAWVFVDSDGEGDVGRIFDKAQNTYLRVSTESAGRVNLEGVLDLAGSDATLSITSPLALSTWNHVAMTWTNDTDDEISIYVNGILRGTSTDGSGDPAPENGAMIIGGDLSINGNFDGRIDEFKLYSAELSAAEILIDMNANSAVALGGVLGTQDNEGFGGNPPVGWWNLNENTGTTSAFDTSGNENTGTLTNVDATDWIPGKYGSALDLDGVNEHITRADDADFDFAAGGSFTIQTWIRHTAQSSGQDILISKYFEAGYKLLMEDDGDLTCGIDYDSTWTPTDFVTSTAATYDDNTWHFVSCVKNVNTSLTLYIDGISVGTPDTTLTNSTLANSDPLYLGIDADGSSNAWLGQIDDIRIYNYARSQAQIDYDYNRGAPLAYYKLDECQATTAYNSAPAASGLAAGMNGTITPGSGSNTTAGNCSSGTTSEMWNDGTTGKRNASLGLDGTDDYVLISDNNALDITGDFTLSAWVLRSGGSAQQIVSKTNSTDGGYAMLVGNAGEVYCRTSDGATFVDSNSATGLVTSNSVWHHTTIVRNGTSCRVYVDGIDRTTNGATHTTLTANAVNLTIGTRPNAGGEFWTGQIDDVRIYNYALTANQVKQVFNNSAVFFGPATGSP